MMNSKKQSKYLLLALAVSATLAGCGGGDSGKGTNSLPAEDAIADYLGTIVQACAQDPDIKIGATMPYRQTTWSKPVKVSPTKSTYTSTLLIYTSSTCTGTPLAITGNSVSKPETIEIVGTKKIGEVTVDKIINTDAVFLFPGIVAKTVTINGVTFSGAYVNPVPMARKDIALWEGNDLYTGDWKKPLDSDGYPTVLLDAPSDSTMH